MGSPSTPPWMSELVARNHKIVRNMWHSLDNGIGIEMGGGNEEEVDEPKLKSSTMNVTSAQEQMQTRSKSNNFKHQRSTPTTTTERQSPISTSSSGFVDEDPDSLKMTINGGGEEESIIEYGPGIVRKLRSRYQSLALRQYFTRPSLRRSTSLENVLDTVQDHSEQDNVREKSPSPMPVNKERGRTLTKSKSASEVLDHNQVPMPPSQQHRYEKKITGTGPVLTRGRAPTIQEKRDRMRRTRSVDVFQRSKEEEEILEKLKAVVSPKEEIVIIEVSKPRGGSNLNGYANIPDNRLTRSFSSPEHELPPHDIVRETARIFEKNQENNKRIAQALRMSKSPPTSRTGSVEPQPQAQPQVASSPALQNNKNPQPASSISMKPPGGFKQVGIIRPTVSQSVALNANNAGEDKKSNGFETRATTRPVSPNNVISPILSPTQSQSYKAFLQQNTQKPPLSPKPLFTSSPNSISKPVSVNKTSSVESPATSKPDQEVAKAMTVEKSGRLSPSPVSSVNQNGESSKPKRQQQSRDSPSPTRYSRAALRRTPNSFILDEPPSAPLPVPASLKSSSPTPPLSYPNATKSPSPVPIETTKPKTVTAKITETATVSFVPSSVNKTTAQPTQQFQQRRPTPPATAPPPPPTIIVKKDEDEPKTDLRTHQKQKSNQLGNSTMVFNFTTRSSVPDYIEDDGLRGLTLAGTVTDESVDDIDSTPESQIDPKLIQFVGANVIINGKSSIQKKPKSSKKNISFNEDAISTYEYPSETSFIAEEEENQPMVGHKTPNSGSGLSSYTPKLSNDYQLGNFDSKTPSPKQESNKKDPSVIEDYLKPDAETTTWSNEITSDILF